MSGWFNFKEGFDYLCDNTNFRYCRLMEIIERNQCPAVTLGKTGIWCYDITYLVLCILAGVLFIGFVAYLKKQPIRWRHQRETRGAGYWRFHLVMFGISTVIGGVSVCLVIEDGPVQRFLTALKGATANAGYAMLFWVTLVDMQIMPATGWYMHLIAYLFSVVVGGLFLLTLVPAMNSEMALLLMGIGVPVMASAFNLLGMLPVVLYRKLWNCVLFLIAAFVLKIASLALEIFLHKVICQATQGYLTGMGASALIFCFYRMIIQLYYLALKKAERDDGLPAKRRPFDATSSSEVNKPMAINMSDYSYSYTYTDSEGDNNAVY